MKSIQVPEFGPPEVLQIVENDDLSPSFNEVTITVEYIGVGLVDSLMRRGFIKLPLPLVPGLEASGYIKEVGENVTELKVGQPVVALLLLNLGGYATVVKAPQSVVVPLPSPDALKTAAASVVNFTTAYLLFHHIMFISPQHRLLVHGASGGLGTACCKLAKAMGVRFLAASTSSEQKKPYLVSLGCDRVIQARDMRSQIPELDNGFDVIVDPVGGNVRRESIDLLAERGKLLVVGSADESEDVLLSSNGLWLSNREVIGVNIGAMCAKDPATVVGASKSVLDLIAGGQITAEPAEVFPFDQVINAHRRLDGKNLQGKIVLRV